ncbi:GbsR/MarR family transcriptional regulator [Bacillus chungangensis]|uniref:DNA-binding transcriptional regulator GbsR (MarR family) n=1 Tax=Bacillus chungangensis TaxID=587633 RepID=A0ABT9WNU5_9BACI|nr:HTH domain-containing protein [Bacillus chungangensis]MDQ0174882.1 DNA-binding transcriptional regulator GbsR (MarR family) [Bacillus chungangensis]
MSDLQKLQDQFSQEMDRLSDDGGSLITGRLFSLLLFSPKPLSLQEMADQLGVTKAAVSIRIRELEKSGLSMKISRISDRRDYYQVANNFSLVLMKTFLAKMNQFLSCTQRILQDWPKESSISEDQIETYHVSKKRLEDFRLIYELFFQRLAGIDKEWELKRKKFHDN